MKSIKMTLFITAAILFSMILGSLKAHAADSACLKGSPELQCEIQYYQENKIALGCLSQELQMYPSSNSSDENVQLLMSAIIKAEAFEGQSKKSLSPSKCETHLVNAEALMKTTNPLAIEESTQN